LGLKLLQVSSFSPSVSQANILLTVHLLKALYNIHIFLILLEGIQLAISLANQLASHLFSRLESQPVS